MTRPDSAARAPRRPLPDMQTVTQVRHWTDDLFSFRLTRPASLRFRSGEFVMIGLPDENGRPILRAYSIASPIWDDDLEFYSIKVPDGPLTSRLQDIRPGDGVILRPKPVGTLVLDALRPGGRLWLFATGTGVAPFASILRDPQTWERHESVALVHGARRRAELEYSRALIEALPRDPLVGEAAEGSMTYLPATTRDPGPVTGRITEALDTGALRSALGAAPEGPEADRAMICGSLGFNADMRRRLEALGLNEGANSRPGEFVVEKAFVGEGV